MKHSKTLIAICVLTATAAYAQSSVTLSGMADAGIGKIESPALGPNDVVNKTKMISGSLMNNSTSNIGIHGHEDIGGGTKIGFDIENNLDLNDGAVAGAFWGRQARLWVGGPWGTFQMGRTYTPSFIAMAGWQLTATANYSVVGNTYQWGSGGNLLGGEVRQNNLFGYRTPNMNGFAVNMAYVFKEDNAIMPVNIKQSKWDIAATYANGPTIASFGVNKLSNSSTSYNLGGKYKFGQFALAASYNNAVNAISNTVRRGFSFGGQGTFGATTVTLDLTRDTKNEWAGKKYTNALIEARYALSKRTFIYAAYLHLDNTNNYGVGLHHNF